MGTQDETDAPAVITATGLGVDGEHGPLFSGIDLALPEGFHAIQMPGGPGQTTLLMTLAGRFKPTHGTLTVRGETKPRAIRRHCAIAAFPDIDELEESVTVQTVLAEQRRWLAPGDAPSPREAARPGGPRYPRYAAPPPHRPLAPTSSNCPIWNCFCCGSRWRRYRTVQFWWSAISNRYATTRAARSRSSDWASSPHSAPSSSG